MVNYNVIEVLIMLFPCKIVLHVQSMLHNYMLEPNLIK